MKETNMERYRSEIEELVGDTEGSLDGFAVVDGKPKHCMDGTCCNTCDLKKDGDCYTGFIKWLMSEYKPEPVLTAREKHFVEAINNGFIARDKNNNLCWYSVKPLRRIDVPIWKNNRRSFSISISRTEIFANDMFPFITWEDEEPWSIERLRELKVQDAD
ncbi:MAG: hypothetical protein Q4B18_07870 [Bacillota bacterium]|nr:hypothetical protein [Bacillota bacterium]